MSTAKYFSGQTELTSIRPLSNKEFAAMFPGAVARRYDGYSMMVGRAGNSPLMPVERAITYKSNPSRHECNSKCMGGKKNGTCECSCGGKNHGVAA